MNEATLNSEAERCRQKSLSYLGKPEAPFLLRIAREFERLAVGSKAKKPVTEGSFEEGYRDGWISVAGDEPLPGHPTPRRDGDENDYACGFLYGRADASGRFQPGALGSSIAS